jgi:hypothetical protein
VGDSNPCAWGAAHHDGDDGGGGGDVVVLEDHGEGKEDHQDSPIHRALVQSEEAVEHVLCMEDSQNHHISLEDPVVPYICDASLYFGLAVECWKVLSLVVLLLCVLLAV